MTHRSFRYPCVRSGIVLVARLADRALRRPTAVVLAAAQLIVAVPLSAAAATPTTGGTVQTSATAPPVVVANRTVPAVTPPPTVYTLPDTPTDAELSAAHIFAEPLLPMSRGTSAAENRALARALRVYANTQRSEMVAPLLQFLSIYPQSAWRASLLANLGTIYRRTGYLSRAFSAWDLAWLESRDEVEPRARAVADFALGEWFELSHTLGR